MLEVRRFAELGGFENDWLKAHHHFSFGHYYDPNRLGHGALLVWNDDTIQPGRGFELHGHRDMEIITYVRKGAITHRDHLGNEGRTEAGDVQVMSAGKGILHAEFNEEDDTTQIFQIWVRPNQTGIEPRWEQRRFPKAERAARLVPLASGRREDEGALPIQQDAAVLGAALTAGQSVTHEVGRGRSAYLVAAVGRLQVNGQEAAARDGVAVTGPAKVEIEALEDSELLLVDVPAVP
ncbi:MAG: pirin family protein [Limibacillus sp.]|jgi:redox-sensitive bicupin YhaK (pirin superfamily)